MAKRMKLIDCLRFALTGDDDIWFQQFYKFRNLLSIDQEILMNHSAIAIGSLYREIMRELYETD